MEISENVKRILQEVGPDVKLVAATKMNDASRVQEAIRAGIKICGENRVQEMLQKQAQGAYEGAELHFIGHLQKNKVNKVVGIAKLIHSVDSIELLEAIDRQARKLGIVQDVLLEINIGEELAKSGFSVDNFYRDIAALMSFDAVSVKGLMTIPPACTESSQNRPYFEQMSKIFVDIGSRKYDNNSMDFLSMGMSSDYMEAIKCGSNMVRVGSAIFGPRQYNIPED